MPYSRDYTANDTIAYSVGYAGSKQGSRTSESGNPRRYHVVSSCVPLTPRIELDSQSANTARQGYIDPSAGALEARIRGAARFAFSWTGSSRNPWQPCSQPISRLLLRGVWKSYTITANRRRRCPHYPQESRRDMPNQPEAQVGGKLVR